MLGFNSVSSSKSSPSKVVLLGPTTPRTTCNDGVFNGMADGLVTFPIKSYTLSAHLTRIMLFLKQLSFIHALKNYPYLL